MSKCTLSSLLNITCRLRLTNHRNQTRHQNFSFEHPNKIQNEWIAIIAVDCLIYGTWYGTKRVVAWDDALGLDRYEISCSRHHLLICQKANQSLVIHMSIIVFNNWSWHHQIHRSSPSPTTVLTPNGTVMMIVFEVATVNLVLCWFSERTNKRNAVEVKPSVTIDPRKARIREAVCLTTQEIIF